MEYIPLHGVRRKCSVRILSTSQNGFDRYSDAQIGLGKLKPPWLGRHSSNTCSWFSMGHWMTMITQWSANIFCYGLRRFRHTACTLCRGSQNFFILRNSNLMSSPNWTLFNNILQNNDTTEQFVTSLQLHVIDCNYRDSNEMVRDWIVFSTSSSVVRERLINKGRETDTC